MNIIFYFSGTGNGLALSKSLAYGLKDTAVVPIKEIDRYHLKQYERIGFVFPVYYIHAPRFVIEKLEGVTFYEGQHIFLLATFSGSWGYAMRDVCSAIAKSNQNLLNKDKVSIQEFCVRMPGSYILEYGALPISYQKYLLNKSAKETKAITAAIQDNQLTRQIAPNVIARIYQRKGMEKPKEFHQLGMQFHVDENCIACGLCAKVCPANNIVLRRGRVEWCENCQQCMACVQWCPNNAIKHPLLKAGRKRYTNPKINIGEIQVALNVGK